MKKFLKTIIPLLIGVVVMYLFISKFDQEEIQSIKYSLKNANYWWVVLSLFIGFFSHLSRAYRWGFMIEPIGYKPSLMNMTLAVLTTYVVNLGVPRAGEFYRATVISQYEGIPIEKAFGTVVAERIADMIVFFVIIALSFLVQYDFILALLVQKMPKNPVFIVIATVLGVLAIYFLFRLLKSSQSAFAVKLRGFLTGIVDGVKSIYTMEKKWAYIFHTVFIWACYVFMLYVIKFAFPETTELSFGAILVCFVAGTFAIAATNGGIGAYPLAIQTVLVLYAISDEIAGSFGLLMWTAQTVLVVVLGGLSFVLLPVVNKSRR